MSHRSSRNGKSTRSVPASGRKFSPEEHAHALQLIVAGMAREEVATSVGCTTESLRRWYNAAKRCGNLPTAPAPRSNSTNGAAAKMPAAPIDSPVPSSAPRDPGSGLGEHETKAILDYKRKHPSMGSAQIRAQLKRFLGWRVSGEGHRPRAPAGRLPAGASQGSPCR